MGDIRKRLRHTAYHEAGHAVASFFLGCGNKYLTIVPDKEQGSIGHHVGVPTGKWFQPDVYSDGKHRNKVEARVMVLYAGAIAESLAQGRKPRLRSGSRSDSAAAADLASYVVGSGEEWGAYLDWLFIRATGFLRSPFRWRAVEVVAEALLAKRTLKGREVRELIRGSLPALPLVQANAV
ncbi:hypothetical protein [Anaeromyxobacter diazotrophicus]|uniref:Peptidase M41 domain-containing protein n=1 Tax=Anaeromyxobacter diazotrophicus TaxID=2590199 RepID=A0A7I9VLS2_9BACT|nr:hypothetical protein [Anaeromyxobacter diazotrophicus]GEJ56937.1 hypothetical protein AMYX_16780 [Anaeromyxobacter diazotrophicus]